MSLAFVWGNHRWPVNSPHKRPVRRKCFHLMTSSSKELSTRFALCCVLVWVNFLRISITATSLACVIILKSKITIKGSITKSSSSQKYWAFFKISHWWTICRMLSLTFLPIRNILEGLGHYHAYWFHALLSWFNKPSAAIVLMMWDKLVLVFSGISTTCTIFVSRDPFY